MLTRPFPRLRKASVALSLFAVLLVLFALTLADSAWRAGQVDHAADRVLVRELGLTDLSLFTEARYTRHPSQTDRHTAFQDHPAALEHFPSGSLMTPPHMEPTP
jgi:hypothetical protein